MNLVNVNRVWTDLLVEELVRAGVGLFCLTPGSRSTPLVTAVAAHPQASHVMHFDERGSAFQALGYARATGQPAAWITTSGTAVANGMPAVVEAATDGVPMLLLTADRPPELRDTGANQTIDQVDFFGKYVRWRFDLPVPDRAIDPAFVLTTADQAVYRARRMPAGPVHLNTMYREPLAPDPDGGRYDEYLHGLQGWMRGSDPYTRYESTLSGTCEAEVDALWARLRRAERGLVVAGRLGTRARADVVERLAARLGWPLLPDVCSQLRLGTGPTVQEEGFGSGVSPAPSDPAAFLAPYYDLALARASFRIAHRPDAVLHVGGPATSKRLNEYLPHARPALFAVVREGPARVDSHHRVTDRIEADVGRFCEALIARADGESLPDASAWITTWTTASDAARRVIDTRLPDGLSEPMVARLLSRHAPAGSGLVLASSMPVRDVDTFGDASGGGPFVVANRGASGIDGTVATAVGLACGFRRTVTLLIGDLALLHDLNSLALAASAPEPIIIVVINNHGGGIFSFLPIAKHEDVFESYFGTPHAYGFEHAARLFDVGYDHAQTPQGLSRSYEQALGSGRSHLIEVTTDRTENLRLHRRLERWVDESDGLGWDGGG